MPLIFLIPAAYELLHLCRFYSLMLWFCDMIRSHSFHNPQIKRNIYLIWIMWVLSYHPPNSSKWNPEISINWFQLHILFMALQMDLELHFSCRNCSPVIWVLILVCFLDYRKWNCWQKWTNQAVSLTTMWRSWTLCFLVRRQGWLVFKLALQGSSTGWKNRKFSVGNEYLVKAAICFFAFTSGQYPVM